MGDNLKYKVQPVQQPNGRRFAVVFQGQYRFIQKTRDGAQQIADKLNKIRERRMEQTA